MSKIEKIELELVAFKLWFQTFGAPNMSSESQRLSMSESMNKRLNELKKLLNNKTK